MLFERRRVFTILATAGGLFFLLATVLLLQQPALRSRVPSYSSLKEKILGGGSKTQNARLAHEQELVQWTKPKDVKIIGLVFYGRKRYVEILECYLRVSPPVPVLSQTWLKD